MSKEYTEIDLGNGPPHKVYAAADEVGDKFMPAFGVFIAYVKRPPEYDIAHRIGYYPVMRFTDFLYDTAEEARAFAQERLDRMDWDHTYFAGAIERHREGIEKMLEDTRNTCRSIGMPIDPPAHQG